MQPTSLYLLAQLTNLSLHFALHRWLQHSPMPVTSLAAMVTVASTTTFFVGRMTTQIAVKLSYFPTTSARRQFVGALSVSNFFPVAQFFFTGRFLSKFAVICILNIPSHLAYVATLPCETLMSPKQAIDDKLQGSVATYLRCGC